MFVGHYGVAFAVKGREQSIPLWFLFIAVQLLDVFWAPLVMLGVERLRIVPGITASNPLDLYFMPYTHSLVAGILWSAGSFAAYKFLASTGPARKGAGLVALAVFSHWVLDFLVHRPDLALYDNTAKVGLGLWNLPVVALSLEAVLLFGGMWFFLARVPVRRAPVVVFGVVMLAIQLVVFFGPPPPSAIAAAWTALGSYVVFAAIVARLTASPAGVAPG